MKPTIAVAGCSTLAPELEQCCSELGLPAKLYASRPSCLFQERPGGISDLISRAAAESDALLIAMGQCCGRFHVEGAGVVSAARCTEMLLGSGTYASLTESGALPLPPPYFSTWLDHPRARSGVEQMLGPGTAAQAVQRVAAIDEGRRSPDPRGLREIERIAQRPTHRLFTGLGHLREALREVAESMGLAPGLTCPTPVPTTALGPGDDVLALGDDAEAGRQSAAEVIAASVQRGTRCVWVSNGSPPSQLAERLALSVPHVGSLLEAGSLQIISPEALLTATDAADEPQFLVAHWIGLAAEALAAGDSGVSVIHGSGWTEVAGLPAEYALAYASRLSAACARWPIFSLYQCAPTSQPASLLEELGRTHPLVWEQGVVRISPRFVRSDAYLGGEDLLEALGRERVEFTCAQARPLVSALADGELDGPAAVALARHVQECVECSRALHEHREAKQALGRLRQSMDGLADGLWERISRELRAED